MRRGSAFSLEISGSRDELIVEYTVLRYLVYIWNVN